MADNETGKAPDTLPAGDPFSQAMFDGASDEYCRGQAAEMRQRRLGLEHIDPNEAHWVTSETVNALADLKSVDIFIDENWFDYSLGNRAAIVAAIALCARAGRSVPKPIADEFDRLLELLMTGNAASWNDIFGPAREPKKWKRNVRRERALRYRFYIHSQALRFGCSPNEYADWDMAGERFSKTSQPPCSGVPTPVDEAFFELLGEAFAMSAGKARKMYYEVLTYHRFGGRFSGPRRSTGLDDCFGL